MIFSGLLFLFIVVPILEIALLLQVGEVLGVGPTLALIILTGVVGAALARMEGLRVLERIRLELAQDRMPAPYLLDGLMILVAGLLLITPGLMTDAIGFALLVPACRLLIKDWLRRRLEARLRRGAIEVTYWES